MHSRSTVAKFSVSVPAELASFLEAYREEHGLSSRSEVVTKGLEALREQALAEAYRDHAVQWREDPDRDFWDAAAVDDGLDSEESEWQTPPE